jgi:MFS family permease
MHSRVIPLAQADIPAAAWPTAWRAWWTVAVLTLTYIVSFVDRTVLSLLIEPIKADLQLSDTQIGLVQGLAFGVFYAVMGLPLGWLADRTSRRGLIAIGAGLWCVATACCGMAASFAQLFAARIAVGVGEAALSPAAMSMISDSFPKERRALPIGVYAAAAAMGAGLALIVGGGVIQLVSTRDAVTLPLFGEVARWQAAFMLVGLGGLLILPLLLTIGEPVRRNEVAAVGSERRIDRFIVQHADFMVRHYMAVSIYSALIYAVLSWVPAQFIRVYGWTPGETGLRYGLVLLLFGGGGTVLGSLLAQQLRQRVQHAAIWITALSMFIAGGLLWCAGSATDAWNALAWYAPALMVMTLPGGTAIQVIQEAVPNRLRGQASAVYYLMNSLVGLALGPLSVGLLTDYYYQDPLRIGSALALIALVVPPLTGILVLTTRGPFARLVAATTRDEE